MKNIEIIVANNGYMAREGVSLENPFECGPMNVFPTFKSLMSWVKRNLDKPVESSEGYLETKISFCGYDPGCDL